MRDIGPSWRACVCVTCWHLRCMTLRAKGPECRSGWTLAGCRCIAGGQTTGTSWFFFHFLRVSGSLNRVFCSITDKRSTCRAIEKSNGVLALQIHVIHVHKNLAVTSAATVDLANSTKSAFTACVVPRQSIVQIARVPLLLPARFSPTRWSCPPNQSSMNG